MAIRQDIRKTWNHKILWTLVLLLLCTACQVSEKTIVATIQPNLTMTSKPVQYKSTPTKTTEPRTKTNTPQVCNDTQGIITRESIHSTVLPGQLVFSVYLPPCYDTRNVYPVLYLLHGLSYTDNQWVRLGMIAAADRLILSKEIYPLIIVLPYNSKAEVPPDSNFGEALVASLIPWVDEQYSTCTDPSCRWIGGLSRGGGWAFYTFILAPDQFGAVGGHSPAMFTHDPEKFAKSLINVWDGQRIWIDTGNKDTEWNYLSMVNGLLTEADIPNTFTINTGNHDETYWQQHIEEYLRWYTGAESH